MKRRDFLRTGALLAGAGLIPVKLMAEDEKLAEDDPQAVALEYTHNSETEGQTCANCIHAMGDLESEWIGCRLFPGKLVAAAGWCKVWAPAA